MGYDSEEARDASAEDQYGRRGEVKDPNTSEGYDAITWRAGKTYIYL